MPQLRVLRFQNPVPFVREIDQAGWNDAALQRREELEAFTDRNAEIELAMSHECRCLKVPGTTVGRPLLIKLRVVPWIASELPLRKPELFRHAVHRLEVVYAGV